MTDGNCQRISGQMTEVCGVTVKSSDTARRKYRIICRGFSSVPSADSDISSLSDLAGKVVVTQADSSALAALTDDSEDNADNLALTASFADLQQVADYNTAFMNLESGAVDAIAVDIGVAKYQVNSRGDAFKMLDEQVSSEQYAVGFKKGNTALCDKVQATLDEMQADGTIDKIAANYADYNVPDMLCLGK